MLIIISGPSGSGKTPLVYSILDTFSVVKRIQSYTTRQKRTKEIQGTYVYMTAEQFKKKIDEDFFLEYNRVHKDGHFYGTARESYDKIVGEGFVAIKDIDVDSYKKMKESDLDIVGIYVTVKDRNILIDRLRERGETQKTIDIRLSDRFDYENAQSAHYDYLIFTDDFEKARAKIINIVDKELKKRGIKCKKNKTRTYEHMF